MHRLALRSNQACSRLGRHSNHGVAKNEVQEFVAGQTRKSARQIGITRFRPSGDRSLLWVVKCVKTSSADLSRPRFLQGQISFLV